MKIHIFKFTAIVLIVAGSFSSCEEDISSSESIVAKVKNADEFSNVLVVKLMECDFSFFSRSVELARGDWKDGGFTIVLPKTLNLNTMEALIHSNCYPTNTMVVQPTMTISNENAKIKNVQFVGFEKNDNAVASFTLFKADKMDIDQAVFTYVDSDVTISGYTKVEGPANPQLGHGDYNRFEIITTYSVEWKKGWNVWFYSRYPHKIIDNTAVTTEQWTSIPVSSLQWRGSSLSIDF